LHAPVEDKRRQQQPVSGRREEQDPAAIMDLMATLKASLGGAAPKAANDAKPKRTRRKAV
jgi:non-homologous end joining protein Ku